LEIGGMTRVLRLAIDLLNLLFPHLCNGCSQSLVRGEKTICTACLHDLPYTDYHLHADNRAAKQLWGRLPSLSVMSMLFFKKGSRVQHLMHRLKYNGQTELGIELGEILGKRLKLSSRFAGIDFVIPVPLHKRRERLRGFNQSKCIADGIASSLGIEVLTGVLIKPVSTSSQTRKGRFSRYENLKSVFQVSDSLIIKEKHVLLVDDVMTTGATLEACALILYAAGVKKLSIATVAFTD
jgi:ComF family protein